jgi:hypothetical protein
MCQMRVLVLLSSIALVAVAGAGAKVTMTLGTLTGVVTRGPIAPICVAEQPCDEPAKHVTLLFSRNEHVAGRVLTDALGRYRIRLPAGLYSVRRPGSTAIGRKLEPSRARVYAGRSARIDVSIDTGIRERYSAPPGKPGRGGA